MQRPVLGLALIQGLADVDNAVSELLNGGAGDDVGPALASKQVTLPGTAVWEGCSFALGVVSGAIAAGTGPGRRSARQVPADLLNRDPDRPGDGIRPDNPGRELASAGTPRA